MRILSESEFVTTMTSLQNFWDFENELNELIYSRCNDGYVFLPENISTTVKVLEKMFNDEENNWIDYFIWDLCFGRKWHPGMITNADGSDCKLNTPQDLYKLLMEGINYGK